MVGQSTIHKGLEDGHEAHINNTTNGRISPTCDIVRALVCNNSSSVLHRVKSAGLPSCVVLAGLVQYDRGVLGDAIHEGIPVAQLTRGTYKAVVKSIICRQRCEWQINAFCVSSLYDATDYYIDSMHVYPSTINSMRYTSYRL